MAPPALASVLSAAAPLSAGALSELLALPEPPHAVIAAAIHTDSATARLVLKIFFIIHYPPL
jgi:hypothetical protein